MRSSTILAAASLLIVACTARADSYQFSISSNAQVTVYSPNDNYYGEYRTLPDATGTTSQVFIGISGSSIVALTDDSFFLPAGSTITSATLELILPNTRLQGTSVDSIVTFPTFDQPRPVDPSNPTLIAPTLQNPGTAFLSGIGAVNGAAWVNGAYLLSNNPPTIAGNEVSILNLDLFLQTYGGMDAIVATQGYNWDGFIGGTGQINLPYTLEIDGNFTPAPTPEPCSLTLLGTGMAVLLGVMRRRALV